MLIMQTQVQNNAGYIDEQVLSSFLPTTFG